MASWLPIPAWDGLHPLIVHFPIALLLVAPLFLLLGLVLPKKWEGFRLSALLLMLLGTIAAWIAVSTGEAAGQMVTDLTPEISKAIQEHAEWGGNTRLIFSGLTLLYALLLALPLWFKSLSCRALTVLHLVFLVIFGASCLVLARTGHLGGRLVHAFGVHAMVDK